MARFLIIGPERIGGALAAAFADAGHEIVGALAKDPSSKASVSFQERLGAPVRAWVPAGKDAPVAWSEEARQAISQADGIVIAVPEAAVTPVAQTLAQAGVVQANQVVVHTSGSQPHRALLPLMKQDIGCACMHPLQTVVSPDDAPGCFRDVVFTIDGTSKAVPVVTQWVESIGGAAVSLDPDQRAACHAAGVLASDAVVALVAVAAGMVSLPGGSRAFLPLLKGAVANLERYGLPEALTGPVERGEVQTVSRHLIALANNPTAKRTYLALQSVANDVARHKGSLTAKQWQVFHDLFEGVEDVGHSDEA